MILEKMMQHYTKGGTMIRNNDGRKQYILEEEDMVKIQALVKNCRIGDVRTRFPDGELELFLENGNRKLKLRGYTVKEKRYFVMNCMEYWEADDPDFGEPEQHDAFYYPTIDEINEIIATLQSAKVFLNGC